MKLPELREITTADLYYGKHTVSTFYGVKFIIDEESITSVDPFHHPQKRVFKGKVEINSCRVGGWLSVQVQGNGDGPFFGNCICITSIEAKP